MTTKIEQFALDSGLAYKRPDGKYWIDAGFIDTHLEQYTELVRQDEREACAKLCDEHLLLGNKCAAAIRARGDKHD